MKRRYAVFVATGLIWLVAGWGLSAVGCKSTPVRPGRSRYYLLVVPVKLPGGRPSEQAVAELKQHLVKWAGGYTVLGTGEGGWWDGQKTVTEPNIVFFVEGPPGMRPRLTEYIKKRFAQQEAYVAEW